jgi:hypothetical protein
MSWLPSALREHFGRRWSFLGWPDAALAWFPSRRDSGRGAAPGFHLLQLDALSRMLEARKGGVP